MRFIESQGLKKATFERLCGLSNGAVDKMGENTRRKTIDAISNTFPTLNTTWLLTGEGEMLKQPTGNTVTVGTAQQSTVVGGNYYGTPTRTHEEAQPIEAEQIPVVPVTIAKQADVDTLDYLRNNMSQVEISSVNVDDMQLTFWLPMPDDNMEPEIRKGDRLGLWAYPDGKANPIPGKIYAVETYSNGFIVRYLFITPEGDYLMRSQNPELFPDFIVRKDDVMRVYKKLIMVRI